MTIDILLSTYNGAKFVDEQIESILSQTFKEWKLLIRDDGSKDETPQKLLQWQKKYPDKISLLLESNVGVIESFNRIYKHSTSPYIAFCDQDDVWLPNKLQKCLELLKDELEPTLVHSDLTVVDHEMKTLGTSFWKYSFLSGKPKHATFNRLLVQNVVTGCTSLFNRKLANLAFPTPEKAIMHDWWFALVAAHFGKVLSIDEPLMLYRQHLNNTVGAKPFSVFGAPKRNFQRVLRVIRHERKKLDQAESFLKRYSEQLNKESTDLLTEYVNTKYSSRFQRLRTLIKHRLFKIGVTRNVFHLFFFRAPS
jgi:glycosyltransferase involved in cell wall biosynthesis